MYKFWVAFGIFFFGLKVSAQVQLPVPRNIASTYKSGTRNANGSPGKNYWQNTANYTLNVDFNPATLAINGVEEIEYINNSPDTLKNILFKIYPNIYQKGAQRLMNVEANDLTDGLVIDTLLVNSAAQIKDATGKVKKVKSTNINVRTDDILPKAKVYFTIRYHYTLNKGSHIRTGEIDPGADFIAYFFPRIAVYDDVDGWNTFPYLGTQEFYNDFCNFKVNITVPQNFMVWCTGDLTNAKDVIGPKYLQRLLAAEHSDATTTIIDSSDLVLKDITTANAFNTFRFEANGVSDVAFAVSDHYMWHASSLVVDAKTNRRTRVDVAFNPKHKDFFDVVNYARKTVEAMSFTFPKWPYPYSHETVFDGLDQMEYPMMVNDNPLDQKEDAIELTDHEIFHTMFPFYMGINETKYGWMDEGWATIGEWLISPMIDTTIVDNYGIAPYENAAGKDFDVPVTTLTTQLSGTAFFLNSYPKPAFGYLYIKDMLGDSLFTKALHNYITLWHGKHPIPQDFFNSMNAGAGKNMDWFWKKWFYEDGMPNLAITNVVRKGNGYTTTITNKGNKPVPVDITLTFAEGGTQKIHRTIAVWEKGNATITIPFITTKKVTKLTLGSTYTVDSDKSDNVYLIK